MPPRARFFAPEVHATGQELLLAGEEFHHLRHVLRLHVGDIVSLFDGAGRGFEAKLVGMDRSGAVLRVHREELPSPESFLRLHLAVGLAKGEKLDLICQKSTELGVVAIHPLATRLADRKLSGERAPGKLDRWRRVALEACKQSGRTRLPEILPPVDLETFLSRELPALRLLADPAGDSASRVFARGRSRAGAPVVVAVGPEGGWHPAELELFRRAEFDAFRLGPRILRAETAAILAAGLLQFLSGDLADPPLVPPSAGL